MLGIFFVGHTNYIKQRHRLVKGCGSGTNDSHEGHDNSPPDEIKPEDDDIPVSVSSVAALRA